ncbi:GNAT family N-acetyltransferase [Paenibacillus sp. A14]|uniref:GNAT family N-acetyltransferase n=1 Tax=Paenibacillus sp. A14 TaxID=3119820 RepID=UPI002FE1CD98
MSNPMLVKAWQLNDRIPWELQQAELIAFTQKYGRKALPANTILKLMKLSSRDLLQPGALLLLAEIEAEDGPRLAGFSCVTHYGRGLSLVVVHPLYRGRGLGSRLLSRQISALGRLSCRVPLSSVSGLQMCFRAGLYAGGMVKTPGGPAELILERR